MLRTFLAHPVTRSALTTFLVTFLSLVPLAAVTELDFQWLPAALIAAATAAVRTLVAAIDPGNTSFGVGTGDDGADAEGGEPL